MSDRKTTSSIRRARVIRPPVISDEADTLDDTDENKPAENSVSRTRTPADQTLSDLIQDLRTSSDAAVPDAYLLALREVARRVAEDRTLLEKQIAGQTRWSRVLAGAKAIGVGSFVAGLAVVAQTLIARGDASATARQQSQYVTQLRQDVAELKQSIADLRAQAAADHSLIQVFAARLSTAPNP